MKPPSVCDKQNITAVKLQTCIQLVSCMNRCLEATYPDSGYADFTQYFLATALIMSLIFLRLLPFTHLFKFVFQNYPHFSFIARKESGNVAAIVGTD
jgi:hypothetical protein